MLYLSLYTAKVYFVLTVVIIWVVTLRVFVKIYLPKQVFFLDTVFVLLLALMVSYDISTRPINMEGDTLAYHDFYIDLVNGIIGPFDPAFLYLGFAQQHLQGSVSGTEEHCISPAWSDGLQAMPQDLS